MKPSLIFLVVSAIAGSACSAQHPQQTHGHSNTPPFHPIQHGGPHSPANQPPPPSSALQIRCRPVPQQPIQAQSIQAQPQAQHKMPRKPVPQQPIQAQHQRRPVLSPELPVIRHRLIQRRPAPQDQSTVVRLPDIKHNPVPRRPRGPHWQVEDLWPAHSKYEKPTTPPTESERNLERANELVAEFRASRKASWSSDSEGSSA